MRSRALNLAIEADPVLGDKLHELAEILARTNGRTFQEALDSLEDVLADYLIYAIEEEP